MRGGGEGGGGGGGGGAGCDEKSESYSSDFSMIPLCRLFLEMLPLFQLWQRWEENLTHRHTHTQAHTHTIPTCLVSGKEIPYILCNDSACESPFQYVDEFCTEKHSLFIHP